MCWRTSFTSAPTISAAPSSNRSAFHWTATTSTDASSAPRRCWQIRVRRRPTSRSSWASAKRARSRRRSDTHDWDHSNRLPPHPGMKPRPRRNGGLNPRSSTSPGLSIWRVDTKRGVSYSTPMSARPIRWRGRRSRRAPHPSLTLPSGDQPASAYAGGSTALKTISMSCSGKASLDTPIRLLAHRGRATA